MDDFLERVTLREGVDKPVAVYHARVVIETLQETVSEGQIDNLRSQLSDEWDVLFDLGAEGNLDLS